MHFRERPAGVRTCGLVGLSPRSILPEGSREERVCPLQLLSVRFPEIQVVPRKFFALSLLT